MWTRASAGRGWHRLVLTGGFVGLAAAAVWARFGYPPAASAQPVAAQAPAPTPPQVSESAHSWVAMICDNIPITREEFGEYLIARHADQLEMLINKRIIEHACKEKGIEVTAAEVDASLAEDLKGMNNLPLKDFVEGVLKRYHKTLYEWKEDVIRPKLLLTKLCREKITVTEQDYKDAFDAHYGEKVQVRIILFKQEDKNKLLASLYGEMRKSDAEFERQARMQASPTLAAAGGKIQPITHHTTGNEELEKEAFSLKPGELSRVIDTPQGVLVMKCDQRIAAETTKTLAAEKPKLEKEIIERKVQMEIPKLFQALHDSARVKNLLRKTQTEEELLREVKRELQPGAPTGGVPAKAPQGN